MNGKSSALTQHDPGQDYLASLSDVMSGLIFLFVITLTIFALRLQGTRQDLKNEIEQVKKENQRLLELQKQLISEKERLEAIIQQLVGGKTLRAALLEAVQKSLSERGFRVEVDLEHGILRLPEEVLFPSGSDKLQPEGEKMLNILGEVFCKTLPEFTIASGSSIELPGHEAKIAKSTIEAIFIEGHTDNVPMKSSGGFKDNWDLSTGRGIRTFKSLLTFHTQLGNMLNQARLPIFSVSGYADQRPVAENETDSGRQRNRRIDIRFIMTPPKAPPKVLEDIEKFILPDKPKLPETGAQK